MIKISVLVPVYSVEKYIERCARSLFEQKLDDIEYIFVDDASPDKSIEILEHIISEYPAKKNCIKIIKHEINKGLAQARNTGLNAAKGKYIYIIDSDDYIEPDTLKLLYIQAEINDADVVFSDYFVQFENYSVVYKFPPILSKSMCLTGVLNRSISAHFWTKLILRDVFEKNHIRVPLGLDVGEDMATFPRVLYYVEKIVQVKKPLYHYVQYNVNAYTRNVSEKSINNYVGVLNYLESFFSDKEEIYRDAIRKNKIITKLELIRNTRKETQKKASMIFDEINIGSYINELGFLSKIVFIFSKNNLYSILNIILDIRTIGGKIKRHILSSKSIIKYIK
jgi:glycosyltransferase involved in cell wall biosynthesis